MNKDYVYNQPLSAPLLALKTGSSPDAKTTNAFKYKINSYIYSTTAIATIDLPSTFTIETGYQQGITVCIDDAGALSFSEGATLANTEVYRMTDFDHTDIDVCIIGFILVKNATGSQFVGNTTALDTSNLTVTYIDNFGVSGV